MSIIRRSAAALIIGIGSLTSIGIVIVTATPAAAQPACTDNWIGPSTGTMTWGASASNWSSGIPNGSAVACVNEAGSYTVLFNDAAQAPEALEVGGATSGTQTVEINGANMATTQDDEIESGGVLSLVPTSSTDAEISGGASNDLTIDAGGILTSSGTSEQADVGVTLVNEGTMNFGATTTIVGGNSTTNDGSLNVSSGATVTEDSATFTDASGMLTNDGTFNGENVFVQSGTTESGNPVIQHTGTFVDSAGTGSFETESSTTLEGTIPVGQAVTNLASPGNSDDTIGTSSEGVTVDGSLTCETVSGTICSFSTATGMWPGVTVASGGTLETTGPGNETTYVNLDAPLQIESGGTVTISNPETNYNSSQITDDGTLQVSATGYLIVGGNTVVDASGGTIGVTDGQGALGTVYFTSGSEFTCSALAVATVGSPVSQTVVFTRNGNGCVFDSFSFGPDYYTVTYPENASDQIIQTNVTSATPFSVSPTPFSAAENEAVTNPEVATFDTNSEPGTYSATVDYGDGTGTQAATVNLVGDNGSVIGPTHTYSAPGTYTVTVTVSTTAGTTIPVTQSITVTGPTITGLSKTTVKHGKSLKTTVSGSNFDGTGTFSTSDPANLSVTSVKFVAATKKKPATYLVKLKAAKKAPAESVSLTLTQTGTEAGTTTELGVITIH